jgi:hypothetical protein
MRNIIKISTLICMVVVLNMAKLPYSSGHDQPNNNTWAGEMSLSEHNWSTKSSGRGYKPVPDAYRKVKGKLASHQIYAREHDNYLYEKWCEETFDNGKNIYTAYKDIAFNIKYKPDANKTDFWQTPIETHRLRKGDCEDAVFLFFSRLPLNQENAEIVWGWLTDKQSKIRRAHVWYQLIDKKGQKYIAEGFSKDWNGIIPMEITRNYETREPLLSIPHNKVIKLVSFLLEIDDRQAYGTIINLLRPTALSNIDFDNQEHLLKSRTLYSNFNFEFAGYPVKNRDKSWNSSNHEMCKEIFCIFRKLRKMFLRYDEQKKEMGPYVQISNKTDLRPFNMENNFNSSLD